MSQLIYPLLNMNSLFLQLFNTNSNQNGLQSSYDPFADREPIFFILLLYPAIYQSAGLLRCTTSKSNVSLP